MALFKLIFQDIIVIKFRLQLHLEQVEYLFGLSVQWMSCVTPSCFKLFLTDVLLRNRGEDKHQRPIISTVLPKDFSFQ